MVFPDATWAQNEEYIFLTINAVGFEHVEPEIKVTEKKLEFNGTNQDGVEYTQSIEFFGELDVNATRVKYFPMNIFLVLTKKEAAWWPRLPEAKGRHNHIKIDWSRWRDEDDEPEAADPMAGMDMSQLMNMGGGAGMEGMDMPSFEADDDSDDEERAEDDDLESMD